MAGNRPVTGSARAAGLIALLLLLGAGLGALALVLGRDAPAAGGAAAAARPERATRTPAPDPAEPRRAPEPRASVPEAAREAPRGLESAPDLALAKRPSDARFNGPRGRIRGFVDTADATPFPREWRLLLEPSRAVVGPERAEPRALWFQHGEQEFVLDDVPLGAYDLIAEAPGLNGERHPILLDRRSNDPYVTLLLHPAGYVAGRVLDHQGLAALAVPVTLRGLTHAGDRATATDGLGNYRFDGVLDGDYQLLIGPPERPLIEPSSLRVAGPSLTVPDRELPALSALEVLVLDARDQPVAGVRVRGSSTSGGVIDVVTDAFGRALAPHLPAGRYRVSADDEVHGRARSTVEVTLEPRDLVLRFRALE